MLNSEVIFLEFVTGTSDFGGKLLKFFQKKNATRFFGNLRSVAEGNTTNFFWPNDPILLLVADLNQILFR